MIPNLPTDNMYKFIALFGLFIMFLTTYFFLKQYNYLDNKIVECEIERKSIYSDYDNLGKINKKKIDISNEFDSTDNKLINEPWNFNKMKMKYEYILKQNENKYNDSLVEWLAKAKILIENRNDFEKTCQMNFNLIKKTESLEIIKKNLNKVIKWYVIVILIALLVTISGFVMWYTKKQKYEDLIIKNNAN